MNTTYLKTLRSYFFNDLAPREISRANMRKWVASVRRLGNKWLLHPANAPVRIGK